MKGPAQYEANTQEARERGQRGPCLNLRENGSSFAALLLHSPAAKRKKEKTTTTKTNRWKLEREEPLCLDEMARLKAICFVNDLKE